MNYIKYKIYFFILFVVASFSGEEEYELEIPDINIPVVHEYYNGHGPDKYPGVHDIGVYNISANIKSIYLQDGTWVNGSFNMSGRPDVKIFGHGVLSSGRLKYRGSLARHYFYMVNSQGSLQQEDVKNDLFVYNWQLNFSSI